MCRVINTEWIYVGCLYNSHYTITRQRIDWHANVSVPDPCPNPKNEDGLCENIVVDEGITMGSVRISEACPFCAQLAW